MEKAGRIEESLVRAELRRVIWCIVMLAAFTLPAAAQTAQWSVQQMSNGNPLTFRTAFSTTPVVLTSA